MSPPGYRPVPQHELPLFDIEQPKPESDDDLDEPLELDPPHRTFSWKRLLFVLLSMAAFFQASYLVAKHFAGPAARTRLGTPCRGSGRHRNFSSAVNGARLQRHFTLPSGDKIPSVALGTSLVSGELLRWMRTRLSGGVSRRVEGPSEPGWRCRESRLGCRL